jgi:proteasome lid subunit RPN8/RPN11
VIAEVRIAGAAWDAVVRHALDAWPDECCGLLIGDGAAIVEARPARNVSADRRRRFEVDPADHFDAIRAARARAMIVCGAYHSHPEGDPRASETDLAEAFEDEEFVHLIVRPGGRGELERNAQVAAYRLVKGNFVAVRLVRVA